MSEVNYYGSSTCGARRAYHDWRGAFFTDNGTKVSLVAQRAGHPGSPEVKAHGIPEPCS